MIIKGLVTLHAIGHVEQYNFTTLIICQQSYRLTAVQLYSFKIMTNNVVINNNNNNNATDYYKTSLSSARPRELIAATLWGPGRRANMRVAVCMRHADARAFAIGYGRRRRSCTAVVCTFFPGASCERAACQRRRNSDYYPFLPHRRKPSRPLPPSPHVKHAGAATSRRPVTLLLSPQHFAPVPRGTTFSATAAASDNGLLFSISLSVIICFFFLLFFHRFPFTCEFNVFLSFCKLNLPLAPSPYYTPLDLQSVLTTLEPAT